METQMILWISKGSSYFFLKALQASRMLIPLPSRGDASLLISGLSNQIICLIWTVNSLSKGLAHHHILSKFLGQPEIGCDCYLCFFLGYYKKGMRSIHEVTRKILQRDLHKMMLFRNIHLSMKVKLYREGGASRMVLWGSHWNLNPRETSIKLLKVAETIIQKSPERGQKGLTII